MECIPDMHKTASLTWVCCIQFMYPIWRSDVSGRTVTLMLNQQQLELLDRTIAKGVAVDREALIKLALREYAERHGK